MQGRNTPPADWIRDELERMRKELSPEQYARESARLLKQLERQAHVRYART